MLFRLTLSLFFLPFYPLSRHTDFHENRNNCNTSIECAHIILFDFLHPVITTRQIYKYFDRSTISITCVKGPE